MSLESRLREVAVDAALSGVGFCSADPFPEVRAHIETAVGSGRSAGLGFTFADPTTASDPRETFPWAKSVVAAAHAYLPVAGAIPSIDARTGVIARFATEDHYEPLRAGLDRIRSVLEADGYRAEVLCDDNRLADRAVAVRAGIAWWGKSTMVLAPGAGPWLLLGSVVTDADLQPDEPMRRDCGSCDACIPACPTGAIIAPGVLDARRCLAAIAQTGGSIPVEFREPMGQRFYGCDECLVACPPGQRSLAGLTEGNGAVDLVEILAAADRPLRSRFAHFYVPRNQARYLRRNAIVAAGNGRSPDLVPVLAGMLGHPDSLLRGHSAWALGRIGGPVATAVLRFRLESEQNPEVLDEIARALGTLG